ncbi:MAG: PLP-dependent aminotransferase family protein [Pseudomonadota bacterium]
MPLDQPRLWLQLFEASAASGQGRRDQLCTALRRAIRAGTLGVGERLPASRVLARDLALSRVTVEAAYAQLAVEGYLHRQVGQGSFVAIDLRTPAPVHVPAGPAAISRRGQRMLATGGCMEPLLPRAFAAGSPDLRAFPSEVWRRLLNRRLRTEGEQLMRYGDPQGRADLRQAIADYLVQSRGVRCTVEQVLVLTSSQQALQQLALLLLDEGDPVWMEEPGYSGARTAFAATGARIVNLPVDADGARPDAALAAPRLVYLTPAHQFPTGQALGLARRRALLDMARLCGAWIIEDDYDSEFEYEGRAAPSLQGLDEAGRVIYLGTFSKTLFPSLRLAYAVLPPALVQPLVIARSIGDGHSSQLMQAVTADFITQGHFAAHLRLMRQLYRSRRDILLGALTRHLPWAQPLPSTGGLQLCVQLPVGSEKRLTRLAAAVGVETPSLSALYQGQEKVDGWRLGFAALQPEQIELGVVALTRLDPDRA